MSKMRCSSVMCVLGLVLCTAAQKPTPEEQQRILETARHAALAYGDRLPDFICTETVQRFEKMATLRSLTDSLTIQLTYFGHKEDYKLIAINESRTERSYESLDGLISGGEFGTLLLRIFERSSAADFEWKGWSNVRGQRVAVFSYRIPLNRSHYELGYRDAGRLVTETAGYHGEVLLQGETVLRFKAIADDIPKGSGILQSSVEVDYEFTDVAGRNYMLPVHAVARMTRGHRELMNIVAFVGYRKFEADSTIEFHKPGR